jgi:hypothetical protein
MDELMDMIGADESASQITDKIKDLLFTKSAGKVDAARPVVASSLFGDGVLGATSEPEAEEVSSEEDTEE